MIPLLLEGLESAWLPCSLVLLVPGAATLLAASERAMIPAGLSFAGSSVVVAWFRFSDRGGDWPLGFAAVALIGATVLLLVPLLDAGQLPAIGAGILAGGASAELWEPCVGSNFGLLLNDLPTKGVGGLALLLAYGIGVLAPLIGVGALLRVLPEVVMDRLRPVLAVLGGTVLAVAAVATAAGLHDDIVGRLFRWSL